MMRAQPREMCPSPKRLQLQVRAMRAEVELGAARHGDGEQRQRAQALIHKPVQPRGARQAPRRPSAVSHAGPLDGEFVTSAHGGQMATLSVAEREPDGFRSPDRAQYTRNSGAEVPR